MRVKKSKNQSLQELVDVYRKKFNVKSVDLHEVAAWAVREKLWELDRKPATKMLYKELAIALRDEYFTDPQGRRVRKKHAQRITKEGGKGQLVLWHDITEASRPEMQSAFQQRRQGITMDCSQLKKDVDSFNENYNKSVPIQMVFDFTEDLEELEQGDDEGIQ